ncbi:MAG TPA: TonB-dependent receptor, partial [Opitutus sp.]|nr:TonB-dependent receptor [Opitutus sp.]
GDGWSWETAVNYSGAVQDFSNSNLVRTAAREEAVNSGELNLFAREQRAEVLERLFGSATGEFRSELISWDLKFVGADAVSLPGGGVDFAAGLETREESLEADSNVESRSATFAYDSGTTIDPFDERRRVSSVFAEMNLPLVGDANRRSGIHSADMTIAVRHERYSDTDDPTVPKVSLRYQPTGDDWVLRFTYSRSFAAPALYELNAPTGTGFTNSLAEFGSNQAQLQTLPVESLMPSRSRNFSGGVVWTPQAVAGLSVSVDYFAIEQTDVISNLNAAGVIDQVFHDVEVNGVASPYASILHVGGYNGPTVTEPGQLSSLGIDNFYFVIPAASNLGAQRLDGADVRLAYERVIGEARLRWDSGTTYYRRFDVQVAPGAPFTATAGLVTGLNGSIPRWRSYNTLTWTWRAWSVNVAHTYYAAMRDATWTADFLPDYPERIPAHSVFDASVSYEWKGGWRWLDRVQLTIGVNNMGDRLPPKSATFDGIANADVSEFDPIGRLYYVAAKHRF